MMKTSVNETQETVKPINPAWRLWVCNFNAGYHDYGWSEDTLTMMLGPEPPKYLKVTEPHYTAADFCMEPRL